MGSNQVDVLSELAIRVAALLGEEDAHIRSLPTHLTSPSVVTRSLHVGTDVRLHPIVASASPTGASASPSSVSSSSSGHSVITGAARIARGTGNLHEIELQLTQRRPTWSANCPQIIHDKN